MAYERGMMTGPPIPPPDMPSLSAYPVANEDKVSPQKGAAVFRLFEAVIKTLDTIAATAPGQADALDDVKNSLRDILVNIVNQGAQDKLATRGGKSIDTPNAGLESVG